MINMMNMIFDGLGWVPGWPSVGAYGWLAGRRWGGRNAALGHSDPLGGFLVDDDGSSDRAELHSALHNAGAWADVREPIGRWVGCGFGRFRGF